MRRGVLGLGLVLAACGGSSDDSGNGVARSCPIAPIIDWECAHGFEGNASIETVIALTCPLCTVSNPERAIDGNPNTWATVTVPLEADQPLTDGGVTLIARAQPGASYGGTPGVSFSFGSASTGGWVFVTGSLNGQRPPFISSPYRAHIAQLPTDTRHPIYWTGSAESFDAVEVQIGPYPFGLSNSTPLVGNLVVNVHEICPASRVTRVCIPPWMLGGD